MSDEKTFGAVLPGESFRLETGGPVWIKVHGGFRPDRGGQLHSCQPNVVVYPCAGSGVLKILAKQQFDDVNASRGAPMGRPNFCDDPTAKVYVFRVRMVDGDYDDGGAYWGGPPSLPLYCCRDADGQVQLFYRAISRKQAIEKMKAEHPKLKPHRH